MATGPWVLRSNRVVTPSGTRAADIVVEGERIARVADHGSAAGGGSRPDLPVIDAGDRIVLPGLVDIHARLGGPGPDGRAGFAAATRAAAAGGFTTLVDWPTPDGPAATDPAALAARRQAADGTLWVDCGFLGGLVPGNADQVGPLVAAGVLGFAAVPGGPGGDDLPAVAEADLRAVAPAIRAAGVPLLARIAPEEAGAAGLLIDLTRGAGVRVVVAPPVPAGAAGPIAEARAGGVAIAAGAGPGEAAAWDGLRAGWVEVLGSDPGTARIAEEGTDQPWRALPAAWTGARPRGFTPDDLARWMAEAPARLVGLAGRKGAIAPGCDADLVVFDPDAATGPGLVGVVEATFLRGSQVFDSGEFFLAPRGRIVNGAAGPDLGAGLARLNALPVAAAREALLACCGSTWWADQMVAARPFATGEALDLAAARIWEALGPDDRLEAFAARSRAVDPASDAEIGEASAEQARITHLRLRELLA